MNLIRLPTFSTKILITLLGLCFCLAPQKAKACAWGPTPDEEYMSFFRSDLILPQGRSFLVFNDDGQGSSLPIYTFETKPKDAEDGNYAEWMGIGNFNKQDVTDFVYNSTLEQLQELKKALTANKKYSGIPGAIPAYILEHKDAALLDYMIFAKTCAQDFAKAPDRDPWEYSLKDDKESMDMALAAEAAIDTAPTEFLRLRYAYQAMRLYRARLDYDTCIKLFEEKIEPIITKSETKDWSRAFYAGALYWRGEYDQAFLEFSKVFQGASRYRMEAYIGSRWTMNNSAAPSREEIVDQALNLAKTEEERMAVLVMAAYQNNYFRNTYSGDKNEKSHLPQLLKEIDKDKVPLPVDLPMLVTWQINDLEAVLLAFSSENYEGITDEEAKPAAREALKETEDQLENILPKLDNQPFWCVCMSYMAYLRGDYDKAQEWKTRARTIEKQAPSLDIEDQLKVLDLVLFATTSPMDAEFESKMISDSKLLAGIIKNIADNNKNIDSYDYTGDPRAQSEYFWLSRSLYHIWGNILFQRYNQADKEARGTLCLNIANSFRYSNYYNVGTYSDTFKNLNSLGLPALKELQKITTDPKTDFERELSEVFNEAWPPAFIVELQATSLIRQHKFAEAANIFLQLPLTDIEKGDTEFSARLYWPYGDEKNSQSLAVGRENINLLPFAEPRAWGYADLTKKQEKTLKLSVMPNLQPELNKLRDQWLSVRSNTTQSGLTESLQADIKSLEGIEVLLKNPTTGKFVFARQMSALQELSQRDDEIGTTALYAYAKGLYNMSYAGNSPYLYTWSRSGSELYMYKYELENNYEFSSLNPKDYYRNDAAREAFLEVVKRTTNKELKARALFMAALCSQGYETIYYDGDPPQPGGSYFTNNPYFEELAKDYKDTEFYRTTYDTCSYLRDYESMR